MNVHIVNDELRTDERIRRGMGDRLRQERKRMGLTQTAMAKMAGGSLRAQQTYEGGVRSPTAEYLAALAINGANIAFILTGQESSDGGHRDATEDALLCAFRSLSADVKAAFLQVVEMASRGAALSVDA